MVYSTTDGLKLNPFNLRFSDRSQEKEYQAHYLEKFLRDTRNFILFGAVFHAIFLILDYIIIPEKFTLFLYIRLFFALPGILLAYLFTFTDWGKRNLSKVVVIAVFWAAFVIMAMIYLGNDAVRALYFVGLILALVFEYSIFRSQFFWASISGWLVVVGYFVTVGLTGFSGQMIFYQAFFLVPVNLLGMVAAYRLEYYFRSDYFAKNQLLRAQAELKHLNQNLENMVQDKVAELWRAKDELKHSDLLKAKFMTVISHQLRTPLTKIRWGLQELIDEGIEKLSARQIKELVNPTLDESVNVINRFSDMFTAFDIEHEQLSVEAKPVGLGNLISSQIKKIEPLAGAKKMTLKFTDELSKVFDRQISLDEEKISFVVYKILQNAIMYGNEGQEIKVIISSGGGEGELKISVLDNGIGIPVKDQPNIFSVFFRAANAFLKSPDGSGVSLSICKKYIEAHGGKIWFESEEGKGSKFYFTVPVK